ncbi:MAG: hypothetical protein H6562_10675 [Lewinellaceae bacterium]|nr:hypothetical protein [Lewinellaceae bacterium]
MKSNTLNILKTGLLVLWSAVILLIILNFIFPEVDRFKRDYGLYFLAPLALVSLISMPFLLKKDPEYKAAFNKNKKINFILFGGAILFGIIFTLVKVLSVNG